MPGLVHTGVLVEEPFIGIKILTTKATLIARRNSHKPAKKATTQGYAFNTARVRKKKRRDENMRVALKKVAVSFSSLMHVGVSCIAEEKFRGC